MKNPLKNSIHKFSSLILFILLSFAIFDTFANDIKSSDSFFIISAKNGTLIADKENGGYKLTIYQVDPWSTALTKSPETPAQLISTESFSDNFNKKPNATRLKIIAFPYQKNAKKSLYYSAIFENTPIYNKKKHSLTFTLSPETTSAPLPDNVLLKHVSLLVGNNFCISCPPPP